MIEKEGRRESVQSLQAKEKIINRVDVTLSNKIETASLSKNSNGGESPVAG